MKTLKQLFNLAYFRRLIYLTGTDQEEIYAHHIKEWSERHTKPKREPDLTTYKYAIFDIYLDDDEPKRVSMDVIARFIGTEHHDAMEYVEELCNHYQTQLGRKRQKNTAPIHKRPVPHQGETLPFPFGSRRKIRPFMENTQEFNPDRVIRIKVPEKKVTPLKKKFMRSCSLRIQTHER